MSGVFITGELTKANTSADNSAFYLELYYTTTREGRPESVFQSVALDKEHLHLAPFYKTMVNKQITIPVKPLPTKKGTIFYVTAGDGKPLE